MAIRFAAASGLALAAALAFAAPAKAQGLFSFYEISPRQIAGMLADDGYDLRGPMMRRGDVYIVDVTSISGRPARLIVSARDGRVVERYAASPRARYAGDEETTRVTRTPRGAFDNRGADDRGNQFAMGDLFNPPSRVYGGDLFQSKPTPPGSIPDGDAPRPKRHPGKKHKDVVRTPVAPTPETTPAAEAPKPAEGSSVAAVAPNAAPEPGKPAAASPKPAAAPEPVQTKAEVERRAVAEPAPTKPKDAPRKKLNDLPVGTLD